MKITSVRDARLGRATLCISGGLGMSPKLWRE
jgi:hypothetical protein